MKGAVPMFGKRCRQCLSGVLTLFLLTASGLIHAPQPAGAAENFVPNPQNAYGKSFVTLCQGEQWFIDRVETLLNTEQKSINTLSSRADLKHILTLGYHAGARRLPSAVGELTELKELYLAENALTELPAALYTLRHLEVIDFSHNQLSGPVPSGFNPANFPELKVLLLWDNNFSGPIPGALYTFTQLENLDLSYNQLSGELSAAVGNLSTLKLLDAGYNQLSGSLPATFSNCLNLKALILPVNQFSGSIPDVFGAVSQLEILDLGVNRLSGVLPANLPVSLQKLSTRDNHITGPIPFAYGSLTRLHTLDLYKNELTGSIPVGLAALTAMNILDLSDNQLSGTLPDIFTNMPALTIANVSTNQLAGLVPGSLLTRQQAGTYANISHNYLTGAIAKDILAHGDNFIDGAATAQNLQNRMYLDDYLQIEENQEANIYQRFVTRSAYDMNDLTAKAKLPPGSYTLAFALSPAEQQALLEYYQVLSLNELATIRADASGWYIYVHRALETAHPLSFVLSITLNPGSDYSRTIFKVTSAAAPPSAPFPTPGSGPAGGGGGGGGALPPGAERPDTLISLSGNLNPEAAALLKTLRLISGYPDGSVQADGALTREESARILFNLISPEGVFPYNGQYADVEKDRWSTMAIGHLSVLDILRGYPDGSFRPAQPITRAEFISLLRSYVPGAPLGEEPAFPDIAGHWAERYIHSAYACGLIQGYPDGSFGPDRSITRAEAVAILCKLLGRLPDHTLPNPYTDLDSAHWAYGLILEASRGELPQPVNLAGQALTEEAENEDKDKKDEDEKEAPVVSDAETDYTEEDEDVTADLDKAQPPGRASSTDGTDQTEGGKKP
jgi:Leucine-rich repeat (LRR) protein